jgi:hypothetical protein
MREKLAFTTFWQAIPASFSQVFQKLGDASGIKLASLASVHRMPSRGSKGMNLRLMIHKD